MGFGEEFLKINKISYFQKISQKMTHQNDPRKRFETEDDV